jgi:hypothetical protein
VLLAQEIFLDLAHAVARKLIDHETALGDLVTRKLQFEFRDDMLGIE